MRKFYVLSTLVLAIVLGSTTYAQDFSNKGKDFYLCFPAHVPSGNNATLSIWITSDKASSGTVTMANGAFSATFNIAANGLAEVQVPWGAAHASNAESNMVIKKSIRVKTDAGKPAVVVYAQQWAGARSAATLVLPVNVLGRKYYSTNFVPSATAGGRSQFDIIATSDNTIIKITPRINGVVQTVVNLTLPLAGDMYQYQLNNSTQDLTGTLIESVASPTGGCLPIAVFSGASNVALGIIGCAAFSSSDPFFQQLYPVSTWGKNFGFVPFANYPNGTPYRVLASEDNTKVLFNGALVAVLNAGQIYPATFNSQPAVFTSPTNITADKPICVIQFAQSNGCSGQGNTEGDPDMVLLNPIEQSIQDITIFSTRQQVINSQWLNILIKTTAAPSFRIGRNGCALAAPTGIWQPFLALPGYSYLRELLPAPGTGSCTSPGVSDSYRLVADSGFNAIAYGWGANESYAYSAGSNVKDLYQQIGVHTQFGIDPAPSVCTGTPFNFKVSLPYCVDSIAWDLSTLPGPPVPAFDTTRYTSCTPGLGGPDSTTVVNGVTLYWYSLPPVLTLNTTGLFDVSITTFFPNSECGNTQEIPFQLLVSDPPSADFTWVAGGCVAESFQFTETTPQIPKPTYSFTWNFGDPASGAANTSTLRNPVHTFSSPGTYTVSFSNITTPGCLSGIVTKQVTVAPLPSATISGATSSCINATSPLITFTAAGGTAPYTFTYTINGGAPLTITTVGTSNTATVTVPNNPATTYTYALTSVKNAGSALCTQNIVGQTAVVTITPDHTLTLSSAAATTNQSVCANTAITPIRYNLGGGATGATVTGLPPGVTATVVGTVVTISGAPTSAVGSPFNYSIVTTGNACLTATANGTITVNALHSVLLSSAASTANQSVCVSSAIIDIVYTLSGGATGANFTGLPPGVTAIISGTTITITGTPTTTVGSPFTYSITTTGNSCTAATIGGTITVNSGHTVNLSSAASTTSQAVCLNIAIVPITYNLGGGATGATVTGLPPGVTSSVVGTTLTIIGAPTSAVGSPFTYTVNTTGNSCLAASASGTITVNPNHTVALSSAASTNNQSICINSPIIDITYTLGGGATGATITGLPAGVTSSVIGTTITITGTPTTTVGSPFNYLITTTGNGCSTGTANGTISVNPGQTVNLTSAAATANQGVCLNSAITTITYSLGGGATSATITGLPPGVTSTIVGTTVTITGAPSSAAGSPFNYSITSSGNGCSPAVANGTITVTPNHTIALSSAASTSSQTVCVNTTIASITYTLGGGATGATVTGLPPGVTGTVSGTTLTIIGTPTSTVGSPFNYSITTTGNSCLTSSANGTIAVIPGQAINLSSAASTTSQSVCMNTAITSITYTLAGGATGATVTGLPPGVTGVVVGTTVTISGSPTSATGSPFSYSISTTGNSCSPATAGGTITVNPVHTVALSSAASTNNQSICINTAITDITYTLGGGASGATITGLPPGVTSSVSGTTITITGTPTTTVGSPFNYSITTTGNSCLTSTANGTIAVIPGQAINLSSAATTANQSVCANTAITSIVYTLGGGASNAVVTGLPPGVTNSITGTTLTISGSPTTGAGSPFNYSITTSGNSCSPATISGTITVIPAHGIALSSAATTTSQAVCMNSLIAPITYTISGGATGATVTGLPAGVTGSVAGTTLTISGSPSTATGSPFNYSIVTTGNSCITASANGSITVNQLPTANFNFSIPGCETSTITFTDGSIPNSGVLNNWQWDFNDPASGGSNTSSLQNPTHVFANAGVYNVKLTATTDKGCVSTVLSKTVTINARPKAGFVPPVICTADLVAPFTDGSTIASGNVVAWSWNFADPNATGLNPNTSTLQNPNHYYTVSGNYTVQQIVTSNNGCKDTISKTFTVNGVPTSGFTVQNATALCSNVDASVTDASTVNFGSIIKTEIYWDYANNPTIKTTDNTPTAGEVYTHTYPEFGAPASKTYDIRYVTYSGTNCINTLTKTITVLATPTLQFDPVTAMCSDVPAFQLTQAQLLNGLPGTGVFSGPGTTAAGMFNPATAGAGMHTIRYTFTGTNGCVNFKEQIIEVDPTPGVNAGPDKVVLEGGVVTLTPSVNAGLVPVTYLWTPSTGLNNTTTQFPLASPPTDITYTLKVTTDKGCSASDQVFVKLLKKPEIPNIFSPNGDGIHEKWEIAFLESYPGCTIDIYNRYGQLVYHSVGYTNPWDGKVNGKDVPVGTYYYIVDPKNGRAKMSGYVDVIR